MSDWNSDVRKPQYWQPQYSTTKHGTILKCQKITRKASKMLKYLLEREEYLDFSEQESQMVREIRHALGNISNQLEKKLRRKFLP
jgi:hypothetical protein